MLARSYWAQLQIGPRSTAPCPLPTMMESPDIRGLLLTIWGLELLEKANGANAPLMSTKPFFSVFHVSTCASQPFRVRTRDFLLSGKGWFLFPPLDS